MVRDNFGKPITSSNDLLVMLVRLVSYESGAEEDGDDCFLCGLSCACACVCACILPLLLLPLSVKDGYVVLWMGDAVLKSACCCCDGVNVWCKGDGIDAGIDGEICWYKKDGEGVNPLGGIKGTGDAPEYMR